MSQIASLTLYHFQSCPFCAVTRRVLATTNLQVEQRDILRNVEYRQELSRGGGKTQVPCLRIETGEGVVTWLYESSDIIAYVRAQEVAA